MDILTSNDGQAFTKVATVVTKKDEVGEKTATVSAKLNNVKARYVKIVAHTNGQWLFLDEIIVNPKPQEPAAR